MTDALLLVHAFPLDARMWEPQLAAFSGAVPLLAPHLPGFGGSDPAGDVMTMRAAADRMLEELDRAAVDRALVCGLSMGGYVAFEVWRRSRERVLGLVLANTRAVADTDEGAAARRGLAERLSAEGNAFLVENPPPLLAEGASREQWAHIRSLIADQPPGAIAAASLGMAERLDSTGDLSGIDVPTLVITSSGDQLIPKDVSTAMAGEIPDAILAVIEGAGHLSNLEAPEEFNSLLEEHVERCRLA